MATKSPDTRSVSGDVTRGNDRADLRSTSTSAGLPPRGFRLPASTRVGPVTLRIADLERSLDYYQEVIGLELLGRQGRTASLGTPSGEPLVELRERRGVRPRPRERTGLFHFALLLPDRPSLGRFARHLQQAEIEVGAADHLVSEALYLRDPDHLGIEVATDPLDLPGLLREAGDEKWRGMPAGSVMGHVHLNVGELARAGEFYSEALGFDRMVWSYPGALFLAAGGYHHHLGTNVWAGRNARPPEEDEAQLLEWTIELPSAESLTAAARSLEEAGQVAERIGSARKESLRIRDPWGTTARLVRAQREALARGVAEDRDDAHRHPGVVNREEALSAVTSC